MAWKNSTNRFAADETWRKEEWVSNAITAESGRGLRQLLLDKERLLSHQSFLYASLVSLHRLLNSRHALF